MIKKILNEQGFGLFENYKNLYTKGEQDISYSDGEIERNILTVLKDLPSNKIEKFKVLEEGIIDWPSEYHLSWVRQNILKPINFNKEETILELGGGTGILSEFIAGKVAQLITIEGTLLRGMDIATRCSSFDNLDIIVANFLELDLLEIFGEKSFDKIILIGVLEYVPKYAGNSHVDPVDKLLEDCRKLLKDGGEIVIGIENKIGLKYLLGWEEDHLGVAHYGTQSLYQEKEVMTFTKKELILKLEKASFLSNDFYYPFPDYKLPKTIIKESPEIYKGEIPNLMASLLYDIKFKNYSKNNDPNLHEGRVLDNFIRNGSLGDISNSFLIVGYCDTKSANKQEKGTPFLYNYSVNRRYHFANEMKFNMEDHDIKISKEWYGKKTENKVLDLAIDGVKEYLYIPGDNLHHTLDNLYFLNERKDYKQLFLKWVEFLKQNIVNYKSNTFDLTPYNTIVGNNGVFHFIDFEEWISNKELSITQVVRGYFFRNKEHFQWLFPEIKDEQLLLNKVCMESKIPLLLEEEKEYLEVLTNYILSNIGRKKYALKIQKSNYKGKAIRLIKKLKTPFK